MELLSAALAIAIFKGIILLSPLFSFVSVPSNRAIFHPKWNRLSLSEQHICLLCVWLCHFCLVEHSLSEDDKWLQSKVKKEEKNRLKSKCFSFVEKTHSNWAKEGFSRKFPNGEIVIVSRGNCKLLQGFSKNIYLWKGSCRNLFHKRPPTEVHSPLPSSLWGSEHFSRLLGLGLGAFGEKCAVLTMFYHKILHLSHFNVKSVSFISSEQRFGFSFCLVFPIYFPNTLFFINVHL